MPRPGQVLGLVGTNGIGKSTALKILAGKLKPNLGRYDDDARRRRAPRAASAQFGSPPPFPPSPRQRYDAPADWQEILNHYRGSELQNYFTRILEDNLVCLVKPQYVDHIPRAVKGTVQKICAKKADKPELYCRDAFRRLELTHLLERRIDLLSGGELQRFAIAACVMQTADVYMFDEPSSYV